MVVASFPSPSQGVVHLGPFPLRAYALMIIFGAVLAVVVTSRRLAARGYDPKLAGDAAVPAVLCGILGARIYHVVSSPDGYFGENGNLVDVFKIWQGGLAIWGAIAGGAVGVWLVCRSRGVSMGTFSDAAAPGLALAQAVGRWGNYFNQELYGRATDLPWAVEIDAEHRPRGETADTYHPTFLYESLWNLAVAGLLVAVDRKHRLGRGKLFALYVAAYTAGRVWIEALRIDPAEQVLGLRINVWVSIAVLVAAAAVLVFVRTPVDPPARFTGAAVNPGAGTGPGTGSGTGSGTGADDSDGDGHADGAAVGPAGDAEPPETSSTPAGEQRPAEDAGPAGEARAPDGEPASGSGTPAEKASGDKAAASSNSGDPHLT